FVRLQNVTVDWAVPPEFTRRVGARQVRLYVSGQNLFTATRYSWYDPEVSSRGTGDRDLGWDDSSYPGTRTVTFGMNVGFYEAYDESQPPPARGGRAHARGLQRLAHRGARGLLHAHRLPRDRAGSEDRARWDRRLVHRRLEPAVLHPRLADPHRSAVRPNHHHTDQRLTLRAGQLHARPVERVVVARVAADLRRDQPGERRHRADPAVDDPAAGREGPLPPRLQVSPRVQSLQRRAGMGQCSPHDAADERVRHGQRDHARADRGDLRLDRARPRGRGHAAPAPLAR